MQKKIGLTLMLTKFLLLALILSPIISAQNVPVLPHQFYGYAIDEYGNLISNGTVTAKLGSRLFTTPIENGTYGLLSQAFPINGTNSDIGDIITFYINDTLTANSVEFQPGGINNQYSRYYNLSFDITPPIISSVSVSSITSSQAKISWITNENSNSTVNYGKTKQLGDKESTGSFVTNHEIIIESLESDTTYYFEVLSYDASGNFEKADDSGNYYSFTTDEESQTGGNGNGGSSSGDNGGTPTNPPTSDQENIPPIVNSGGPYYYKINTTILFDASASSDSDGYIVEYSWDFGDGSSQKTTDTTITYIYTASNTYLVTLTITDNDGATNTTTTNAYITDADSDGDGWTDEAEEYYGYDPNDNSSYPTDNDNDKVPDDWDSDDDNDGLTDIEEEDIGSDSKNRNDVLRIINNFGLFYLVDLDNDGNYDSYYNKTNKFLTGLKQKNNNLLLIDSDNDSQYEYSFDIISGGISEYSDEQKNKDNNSSLYYILFIVIILIIVLIFIIWRKKRV